MAISPTWEELHKQLDDWIAEGGVIAEVARSRKKRLNHREDYAVLVAEVNNMKLHFKR